MQLLKAEGEMLIIVYNPWRDSLEVGDNLVIIDERERRGVVAQVTAINLPDLPGILLEVIRREASEMQVRTYAPREVVERYHAVENMKYAQSRMILQVELGPDNVRRYTMWRGYIPSRDSTFERISDVDLVEALRMARYGL